ncbi:MAG: 30S ribosomal protein S15 [Deltaproteobacteria bacterium CG11_big_fil_rev_8_21_14_0_20_45_16]|nr:MAG: 30S ribosomal protein S15 [Deltaproteobacteria bacterium CG11_big_fil_rev_8_21_14_0_20_45_16]
MISQEIKTKIISGFRTHESDTGSAAVQIAVLSARIQELTEHLKAHSKDFSTRRGLLRLVGRRRRLLNYLKNNDLKQYSDLIARLGLRK